MFDKLLLIAEGYPVYYGKARDSMEYFSSLRFIPDIAMNPAEFLLDLATGQVNDISLPQDLSAVPGTPDSDKAVIKVRILQFLFGLSEHPHMSFSPINISFYVIILVPATQIQNSD